MSSPNRSTVSSAVAKQATSLPQKPRQRRPNYAELHAKPFPLEVYPLPVFIPQNPATLVQISLIILHHLWNRPLSHRVAPYKGTFSPETRSVHVTDHVAMRALWEHGFFGTGNLSRSEPNWLDQELKRRGLREGMTSEQYTEQRRRERIAMKTKRARKDRELIEKQLSVERRLHEYAEQVPAGSAMVENGSNENDDQSSAIDEASSTPPDYSVVGPLHIGNEKEQSAPVTESLKPPLAGLPVPETPQSARQSGSQQLIGEGNESAMDVASEEHLQLSLEEAFFLVYGLGVLSIDGPDLLDSTAPALFRFFRTHSTYPPILLPLGRMDDPFTLNYVVYHYYRSLGWVIRSGNKFGVDFLLYKGGPVFSHAEFAVVIVPSFLDPYWFDSDARKQEVARTRSKKEWWSVHSVNRIQTQALKTLVLVYVEVPPPILAEALEVDVGSYLGRYKVREVVLKRWTTNRSRE